MKPSQKTWAVLAVGCLLLGQSAAVSAEPAAARFTKGPTAVKADDKVRIDFAVSGPTDVAVAVEDAKGKVVRHLAAGVLGGAKSPPAPLKPGLAQSLVWDGKDDAGQPAVGGPFKARVRLGLRPSFGGFIGGSPENQGTPVGLGCDPAGNLYVMSAWSAPNQHYPGMELKSFDRDGRYRRQVMPYPASLPQERLDGVPRVVLPDGTIVPLVHSGLATDRLAGVPRIALADGTSVPLVYHGSNHSLYPQSGAAGGQSILFRPDGKLVTTNDPMGDGPHGFDDAERRVIVLDADGGVGSDYLGPLIAVKSFRGGAYIALALSPDGKTIYAAGYRDKGVPVPVVTRTTWDAQDEPQVFLGDPTKPGAEPAGLQEPRGLATDRQGNLYVCDNAAGRVAVFSPAGKLVGQIAVADPDQVAVHRKTGKIYVLAIKADPARNRSGNWGQGHNWVEKRLLAFDGLEAKSPSATLELPRSPARTVLCVDDSQDQAVLWLGPVAYGNSRVMRTTDAGDKAFAAGQYPISDRVSAGAVPVGYVDVAVDAHTEELLVGKVAARRYDGRSGEYRGLIQFENAARLPNAEWGELEFAADGKTILHQTASEKLFRFDRQGKPAPWPGRQADQRLAHEVAGDLPQGFMHSRGLAAARDGGFYVLHHQDHRSFRDGRVSQVGPDGSILRSNIVQTDVPVGGIRVGRQGHIYVGVHLKPAGQLVPDWFAIFPGGHLLPTPAPPAGWGKPGQLPPQVAPWYAEQYGSLVKFAPTGGRLAFDEKGAYFAPVIGGERNNWSPDWRSARGSVKAEGAEWMWYGLAPMPSRRGTSQQLGGPRCSCHTPRFDLDAHERVYVPDVFRFGVAVLDAAGNLITRFGQYGNQDDGGEGATIPLAWPHAVAASNEAVYVADMVNHRLVRVRLDATSEASCELPVTGGPSGAR